MSDKPKILARSREMHMKSNNLSDKDVKTIKKLQKDGEDKN
jgi:hypothetical protein